MPESLQSPPAIQATAATEKGYDLTPPKNTGDNKNLSPTSNSPLGVATHDFNTKPDDLLEHRDSPALHDTPLLLHPRRAPGLPEADGVRLHSSYPHPLNADSAELAPPSPATASSAIERPESGPRPPPSDPTPQFHVVADVNTIQPSIVRKISNASVTIRHPAPDLNPRSGAYLGNIAALEATAERFSMTSSIEDAIRDAHDELKRSDSRRSSLLHANSTHANSVANVTRRRAGTDASSTSSQLHPLPLSRQSSIVGTNNAARHGGYSPAGYVMSPANSFSNRSTRLRSGSKASSLGQPSALIANMNSTAMSPDAGNRGEDFPFLSRHGPGKGSVRSVMSGKLSLAEIAEIEPPTSLTQDALDEADRAAAIGEDPEDDDTIRASAHQHIESQFAAEFDDQETPPADTFSPMLDGDLAAGPAPRLQLHQPDQSTRYGHYDQEPERPATAESGATFEARMAFGDFDGVHCDPEAILFAEPPAAEYLPPEPAPRRRPEPPAARPTSYFDHSTGQQMLYYPARVPAMLNLPPKLSKKDGRLLGQQMRRSRVMSAMPEASRGSRSWLPDPLEGIERTYSSESPGFHEEPLPQPAAPVSLGLPEDTPQLPGLDFGEKPPLHRSQPSDTGTIVPVVQEPEREYRRPPRLTDVEKRQSRMTNLGNLPPQLRASAFFDLPSEAPKIEMKEGSAMATLDSILDASAAAPVSAFTDHVFAGKLGEEVYGAEKKTKKKKTKPANLAANGRVEEAEPSPPLPSPGPRKLVKRNPSSELLNVAAGEPKKRSSVFNLLGGSRAADEDDRRSAIGANDHSSPENEQEPFSPNQLAPDEDEEVDEEEESEEEEEAPGYQGQPTTLLAELQLRKQQQKLRTRPNPNGLHTTLLELDAVHEIERKTRTKKKVNLAWEDPAINPGPEEDDDEDVPLAMLTTARATGHDRSTMDVSAFMAEVNRPLGLMERRDMEENEPLSRRRDRLQGKQAGPVPVYLSDVQKRMSTLTVTPTIAALGSSGNLHARSQSRLTLPLQDEDPDADNTSEPDVAGETLAERKARLAAENPLPRARPVSGMFSSELLGQFAEPEEPPADPKAKGKGAGRGKENAPPGNEVPEESETLGQRRRRLQMEREARQLEIGPGVGPASGANASQIRAVSANTMDANRLSKRMSMADMLGAHPFDQPQGRVDPREMERLRREAEAVRVQRDQEVKMAMLRTQMPNTLNNPTFGARNGGYMGGRFNDGLGGGARAGAGVSLGYGNASGWPQPQQAVGMGMGMTQGGYGGGYYAVPGVAGNQMNGAMYGGVPNPGYAPYGMGMGMMASPAQQTGQVDRVERWRQSVMQ
ncbi:hypothetical protein GQ53DRAFT_735633 [Thozetella sp. PMI_491]|nr:hypothetical protein GQ53DRAFT_735633 [Thozetella sp. PMI_491]